MTSGMLGWALKFGSVLSCQNVWFSSIWIPGVNYTSNNQPPYLSVTIPGVEAQELSRKDTEGGAGETN